MQWQPYIQTLKRIGQAVMPSDDRILPWSAHDCGLLSLNYHNTLITIHILPYIAEFGLPKQSNRNICQTA